MTSTAQTIASFPLNCIGSIFDNNSHTLYWLPEQFAQYPELEAEIKSDSTALHAHAIRAYSELTVKDITTSPGWSWIKGTSQKFIRKTICVAAFYFTTFNTSSKLYIIVAKTSALFSKIGSYVPGLASAASLADHYSIIDIAPLLMFSMNTALKLLNTWTGSRYPALQKAAHITDVISNKLEVIWWVKIVAVCAFNSLPGAVFFGLLGLYFFTSHSATWPHNFLSSLAGTAFTSLGYFFGTFLAIGTMGIAMQNATTPDLMKIKQVLEEIREADFNPSATDILDQCKRLMEMIKKEYQAGTISRADFDSFAQTKETEGRQWEHLSLEEQADICQQYYKENDRKPLYLMIEKRISHEKLKQYQLSQVDKVSFKNEFTHRYYLARLEAYFSGYTWDEVLELDQIDEHKMGHIHDYLALAKIASQENISVDID